MSQFPAVILVVLNQPGFDVWVVIVIPTLPPHDAMQSRGVFVGAPESEKPSNFFEAVRISRKVNVGMDGRQHVRRSVQNHIDVRMDAFGYRRLHSLQCDGFVPPEMQDSKIGQFADGLCELGEHGGFVGFLIRPEGVEGLLSLTHNQSADQIVGVGVRQPFDIQIHLGLRVGKASVPVDVDGVLPNGERLQCGVTQPTRVLRPLRRPARAEGVGQLRDGEDPLTAVPGTFVLRDTSQEAEVVCRNSLLLAAVTKFAFGTMPVQDGVGHLAG